MINFLKGFGKNKELEHLLIRLENDLSNNYKDNARDDLLDFEKLYNELKASGKLKGKLAEHYEKVLNEYREKMKGYTHKDQTPYWT